MQELVNTFPDQLDAAYANLSRHPLASAPFAPSGGPWKQVLVLGMGGSGISGAVAAKLLAGTSLLPIHTCSDYSIPAWVGPETAVIACSYSGNTEETLAAVDQCAQRGARMACVTGDSAASQLAARAAAASWPCVKIPAGHPPRSQFGQSFAALLHHLVALGAAPASLSEQWPAIAAQLRNSAADILAVTSSLAAALDGRQILLYGASQQAAVLTRWRQQLNENSKLLVNHHVFPEMNHNELVGWESGSSDYAAVLLHSPDDHPRTRARMDLCAQIFTEAGAGVHTLELEGPTPLARVLFAVHWGDQLSVQLAALHGTDPVCIRHIDHLKRELSNLD
jgi:glucose/mannose-6-phosphate isomerase